MKLCNLTLALLLAAISVTSANAQSAVKEDATARITADATPGTQWQGKRVAFLGDSMTDPNNKAADTKYWEYLRQLIGIEPHVFARSGYMWDRLYDKAVEMHDSLGSNVDAIFLWCGTNDFNHARLLGEFFTTATDSVNYNGKIVERLHRTPVMDEPTFSSNINRVLSYLKTNYPEVQIIVMTPIHRGYARFGEKNEQPGEYYANGLGLFLEDYIATLRRGAEIWGVPVIDLYTDSGILPNLDSNVPFISNEATDRLHPSNAGHYRIARTIQAALNALPTL